MCAARELEGASCGNAAKRLRTAAAERPERLPLAATERLAPGQVKQLMGLRRQVGGTLEYHSRAQGLPSGPTSLSELASWPRLMVRDFVESQGGSARTNRLASLLEHGLVVHTDCSGKMTPEAALATLDIALRQNGVRLPQDWLVLFRACDNSAMCQKFIMEAGHRPMHLFSGLLEKLPLKFQEKIVNMRPTASDDRTARAAAHKAIGDLLQANREMLYELDPTAGNCLVHPGRRCARRWQEANIPHAKRPITIAIAGTPCRPFTLLSHHQTMSHSDMEAWFLWAREVSTSNFDLVVLENSEHFVQDLLREAMPPHYEIKHAIFGSQDQGWPVRRCRYYGVCVNRNSLAWTGPGEENVVEDFLSLFGRACCLEGDVFFGLDSEATYEDLLVSMAHRRGMYPAADQVERLKKDWSALLPPVQAQTLRALQSQHAEGSRNGLAGGFAGDLSQSSERLRCGPWIPTLAQSTVMCSLSKNRLLTADELDMCMGWPTIVTPDNAVYASALGLGSSLEGASSMGRRRLAGNGMMMPQVMAWMLYIASHAVRKDRLEGLRLPLLLATVCDKAAESVDDSEDD